jgi:uncharacterized repeat protein (TIGR01451 family)
MGSRRSWALWLAPVLVCASTAANAVGTAAGTSIQNTAQVSYDAGGTTVTTTSNAATVTVAEIVEVNVTTLTSTVAVTPGAANQVLTFRVTNTGNGPEAFRLALNSALVGDAFDPVPATPSLYFDDDGVPGFSPGDTAYSPGTNEPALAVDASIVVLAINNIPAGLPNGAHGLSEITASALTGSGAPGTVYAGGGPSGLVDAVLGASGGDASTSGAYVSGAIQLSAVKSQAVTDQFGGMQPVPGARITYQIVVTPNGAGTALNAAFTDDIPANTTFVAGSLRLNSATLTDSADIDAGQYETSPGARVRVTLGDLTQASGTQTVQFAVTIN